MANPDPNLRPDLRRERERHAGPLIGIALVVIFAVALIFWWMMDEASDAPGPGNTTNIEQNDVDVAPPAAEGEGATDLPAANPDEVTPAPTPDLTPAPDATGGAADDGTGGATGGGTGGAATGTDGTSGSTGGTSGATGGTTTTP